MIWRILEHTLKPLIILSLFFIFVVVFIYQVQSINESRTEYREAYRTTLSLRHMVRQIGAKANMLEVAKQPTIVNRNLETMRGYIDTARTMHESLLRGNPRLLFDAPLETQISNVYGNENIGTHRRVGNFISASEGFVKALKEGSKEIPRIADTVHPDRLIKSLTLSMSAFTTHGESSYHRGVIGLIGTVAGFAFVFGLIIFCVKGPSRKGQAETFRRAAEEASMATLLNDLSSMQNVEFNRTTFYYEPETGSVPMLPIEDPVTEPEVLPVAEEAKKVVEIS
ncbi:MAG: hypothetical protein AAFP70_12355 [Calditrichota bacterium]